MIHSREEKKKKRKTRTERGGGQKVDAYKTTSKTFSLINPSFFLPSLNFFFFSYVTQAATGHLDSFSYTLFIMAYLFRFVLISRKGKALKQVETTPDRHDFFSSKWENLTLTFNGQCTHTHTHTQRTLMLTIGIGRINPTFLQIRIRWRGRIHNMNIHRLIGKQVDWNAMTRPLVAVVIL